MVILLSSGQNFFNSSLSVVFLRFFSVVYLDTPAERFSELGTDLDSTLPQLLPYLGKFIPLFLKKSLARRFGWSIWISGEKK